MRLAMVSGGELKIRAFGATFDRLAYCFMCWLNNHQFVSLTNGFVLLVAMPSDQ